jgi:small subunit ribosomal protein S17e
VLLLGKVRPEYIKRVSNELISRYPQAFSIDFEANKHTLPNYAKIQSKLVRNRIAGYITHLVKFEKELEE